MPPHCCGCGEGSSGFDEFNSCPSAPSLFQYIDIDHITALNEKIRNSAKRIFKPHHLRNQTEVYVESDADDSQLIIRVPFSQNIKLSFISIGMLQPGSSYLLRIFANKSAVSSIDFSNVWSCPATLELSLVDSPSTVSTYPLQSNRFLNVEELVLHLSSAENRGNTISTTCLPLMVFYIGLYGNITELRRDPFVGVYEARPTLADHPCFGSENKIKHSLV